MASSFARLRLAPRPRLRAGLLFARFAALVSRARAHGEWRVAPIARVVVCAGAAPEGAAARAVLDTGMEASRAQADASVVGVTARQFPKLSARMEPSHASAHQSTRSITIRCTRPADSRRDPRLECAPVPADDSAPDLTQRIARVLALAEAWLAARVAQQPPAEAFARHLAFRWESASDGRVGRLVAIVDPALHDLDDLLGVERALAKLVRNTEQFVAGLSSNHVLLYGERGTGKSSAVRGLLGRFAARGLRIIEVHKSDLLHLPDVLAVLRGAPYRFLLFCDDLSFDEGESGYRELKAALEGSLEAPPENVRIIATSNRRHLLPEKRSDNQQVRVDEDGELRLGEAIDEKLALSDRFGLVLGFFGFDQETYLRIVEHLARKAGAPLDDGLRADALRWALDRSSRSGRTARQFVADLAGRLALEQSR